MKKKKSERGGARKRIEALRGRACKRKSTNSFLERVEGGGKLRRRAVPRLKGSKEARGDNWWERRGEDGEAKKESFSPKLSYETKAKLRGVWMKGGSTTPR